jgi:hypothetical protein
VRISPPQGGGALVIFFIDFLKRFEKGIGLKSGSTPRSTTTKSHSFTFSLGAISAESPCGVATFVVSSEPHSWARSSVRMCGANEHIEQALAPYKMGRGTRPGVGL